MTAKAIERLRPRWATVAGLVGLAAALNSAPHLDAVLDPRSLPPGGVAVCRVQGLAPQGLVLAGLHQEAGFYFSPADGCLVALLAVPLGTEPGSYPLALRWAGEDGLSQQALALQVLPDPYPHRRALRVPGLKRRLERSEEKGDQRLLKRAFARHGSSEPAWRGRFAWPLTFTPTVTSPYGAVRVYNGGQASWPHQGVDLRCANGSDVDAASNGVVRLARWRLPLTGGTVLVDHGYGLMSAYFHLSSVVVRVGQTVVKGQRLGLSGHSGLANGPHLHYEMRLRGFSVNPDPWMQAATQPLPSLLPD